MENNNLRPIFKRVSEEDAKRQILITKENLTRPIFNRVNYVPPESFRRISDFVPEIDPRYMISSNGYIIDMVNNSILTGYIRNGYLCVTLKRVIEDRNGYYLHRLVMMCFYPIPDPQNYQVNHKNGCKTINTIWNLEWCTQSENMQHAYRNELSNLPTGENVVNSNLSNDQIRKICELLQSQDYGTYSDICAIVGIPAVNSSFQIISRIKSRQIYKSISKDYIFSEIVPYNRLFDDDTVRKICELMVQGMNNTNILKEIGIWDSLTTDAEKNKYFVILKDIRQGKSYVHITKDYTFKEASRSSKHFTDEEKHTICKLLSEGKKGPEILEILGMTNLDQRERKNILYVIAKVAKGLRFTDISCLYGITKK